MSAQGQVNLPAVQTTQSPTALDPTDEVLPAAQLMHVEAAVVVLENLPGSQVWQDLAAGRGATLPTGQLAQTLAPAASAYLPAVQSTQSP